VTEKCKTAIKVWFIYFNWYLSVTLDILSSSFTSISSAGFIYRLDRLKPRASTFRGPPAKVYTIFNTVIGLSHLCCHKYFLNNPSVIFLTQFHSISEYCRILNTPHHPRLH
jgi:hypothetical protein